MKKHVREAIRLAGLTPAEYELGRNGKHPFIIVNGKRITFAASPKNPDHTTLNLARDILRAKEQA